MTCNVYNTTKGMALTPRKERNDMAMRVLALKVLDEIGIKEELGDDYDEEWAITYALPWVQDDHTEEETLEAIRHQLR